ncbi:MAG: imidazole glycerol phosphate synthase subunit HisH [Alphaproteobacteria bacterium]
MAQRVSVVSYGVGNIQSVLNACARIGAHARQAATGQELTDQDPERIILPGVGAIGAALAALRERQLEESLTEFVDRGVPFLGICVGMQMLAQTCEEFGEHRGLGWIPGHVGRLQANGRPVPHIGWNTVELTQGDDPALHPIHGKNMYFVHSYAMSCPAEFTLATTDYGGAFVSAVRRDHIVGVQFHPEKSSTLGDALLRAFIA